MDRVLGLSMTSKVVRWVLAAAIVVFIVSLSLAVVPHVTPASHQQPRHSTAAGHPVRPAVPPSHVAAPAPAYVPPDAVPSMAQPLAEPIADAPPVPPPPPRLRDRIIEKIPGLNRLG